MKRLSDQSQYNKKKVAIAAPSAGGGGAERVAVELANFFSEKMNYHVRYIAVLSDDRQYDLDPSVEYCLCVPKAGNKLERAVSRCRQLKKLVREFRADCLISFMTLEYVFLAFHKKEKLIATVRNAPEKEFQLKILQKFRMLLLKKADYVVFQTEEEMNYFPAVVKKKGRIIGNPIRVNLPVWDSVDHEHIIIAVGRLTEQKNWPMLLNVFKRFKSRNKEYRLEIYGTGELQETLQNRIDSMSLSNSVQLCGHSDHIGERLKKAEIYVSTSDYEGISNSMLEAMAVGVPVICTDCPAGGARAYIQNGENGFLVPVRDEEMLLSRMEELCSSKELQTKFSQEERKLREILCVENIGKRWDSLL
mgnify:FL=1